MILVGDHVTIATGALQGMSGIVKWSDGNGRFVVTVDLGKASGSVEVEGRDLRLQRSRPPKRWGERRPQSPHAVH